jgi:hypothetical protein
MSKTIRFIPIPLVLAAMLWAGAALAEDRFAALSMIETGDNDFAHGRDSEISRYQIRQAMWLQVTNAPLDQATNPAVALSVAQTIAARRCADFAKTHGRAPTDFEFYVLWNAPQEVDRPSRAVRERAGRFVNLVQKSD